MNEIIQTYTYADNHLVKEYAGKTVSVVRLSTALLNTVAGEHDLTHLNTEEKTVFFIEMERLMILLFQIGGIEHTNDWDIRISFTLRDGTLIGESESDEDYRWSDSFSTPIEATEDLQVIAGTRIAEVTEIEVEVWPSEGDEPTNVKVKIEDIVKFYIGD